ncbi:UNVERIFIED_CONTAM: Retrovirus-related Pol polyprotein from transposon TNT 1-94 [Sesamum angustifolium]|uniref:Retrovirus-related Pol polyprotein from transposon TNT 1-94 n=1 Tax=Sesamum angustifolium TaxID=2727405 RepID=A0AAW2KYB6_9LAMI
MATRCENHFLYGELDRDIFMEQLQGLVSKEYPNHVCRLKKALYGLNADPSLFIKKTPTVCTLFLLYVDDIIIAGDDSVEINNLQDAMSVRFEMKSLSEVNYFLGLEIEKCGGYFMSQKGYATSLLTSLFYLTITRPDIAFSVGVISQFMDQPCEIHLIAAKRILRYIKNTLSYGLMYEQSKSFSLSGFVDVDWAGHVNDRRSTTGFCFKIGSAAISWCSKKQTTVALSSCEIEYVVATMATQECLWLRRLIREMVTTQNHPIQNFCDNESATKLAGNPAFHARSKHIETHYYFVREKVLSQDIEL